MLISTQWLIVTYIYGVVPAAADCGVCEMAVNSYRVRMAWSRGTCHDWIDIEVPCVGGPLPNYTCCMISAKVKPNFIFNSAVILSVKYETGDLTRQSYSY